MVVVVVWDIHTLNLPLLLSSILSPFRESFFFFDFSIIASLLLQTPSGSEPSGLGPRVH